MKKTIPLKDALYENLKARAIELNIPVVGVPITELRGRIKAAQDGVDTIEIETDEISEPHKMTREDMLADKPSTNLPAEGAPNHVASTVTESNETTNNNSNNSKTNQMSTTKKAGSKKSAKTKTAKVAKAKKPAAEKKAPLKPLKDYPQKVQEIVHRKDATKADRIRDLEKAGLSYSEMAHVMSVRYQYIRNILTPWTPPGKKVKK